MSLADETPRNVVESIVRDGVRSQREQGLTPNVRAVTDFVREVVERYERKQGEPTPVQSRPKPHKRKTGQELRDEYEKRIRRAGHEPLPGEWTVRRDPEMRSQIISPRKIRTKSVDLLAKRIRELRLDPEWREKLKGPAAALKCASSKEARDSALERIYKLIEQSNGSGFGDWRKPKPKPLFFDV